MKSLVRNLLAAAALTSFVTACGQEDDLSLLTDDQLLALEQELTASSLKDGEGFFRQADADVAAGSGCSCTRKTRSGTTTFTTNMDAATQEKCDKYAKSKSTKTSTVTCTVIEP